MNAYRLTLDQKIQIDKKPFGSGDHFNPVQDINGDWFIFEVEMEYLATNKSWKRAVLTEYVAPPEEIIPQ